MISIIIPTRNEGGNIKKAIEATSSVLKQAQQSYEILIVDDASKDDTISIVKELQKNNSHIRVLQRQPPYGFGNSIRDGINMAKGDECVVFMADLSDDPKLIPLMKNEIDSGADVVIGSRFITGAHISRYPPLKMLSNRLFNFMIQLTLFSNVRDSSNAFKMFKTKLARKLDLQSAGFEISAEISGKFIITKARIKEIPASWMEREAGEAKFNLIKESKRYFSLWIELVKRAYLKSS